MSEKREDWHQKMNRTDVLLHQDDEYVVMEDPDGWKLMLMADHFNYKFWYEIKGPDGYYYSDYATTYIEYAIDDLNRLKFGEDPNI